MAVITSIVARVAGATVLIVLVLTILVFGIGSCAFAAPGYTGPRTANFDGSRFRNQTPIREHGFSDLLRWTFTRHRGEWSEVTDFEPGAPPAESVEDLRVTFVNHSTVLIQVAGLNILTDPIWSERTSPVSFAGPKRYHPAGIRFEDLPQIDLVIISHNHYDHMDIPTLKRLYAEHRPRYIVGLGNRRLLRDNGIDGVTELDWWQGADIAQDMRVVFVPAQHFSGRGIGDRNKTLWGGYVVESKRGNVYFAGDTGWGPHFEQIAARYSPIRFAILPIGAYQPAWFMSPVHINPAEALEAQAILRAEYAMGIHFGTFSLADDGQYDPLIDLNLAQTTGPVRRDQFWVLDFGESRDVPEIPVARVIAAE